MNKPENENGYLGQGAISPDKPGKINKERIERCKRSDSSVDFILPDYMSDIKRMLNFSAEILPAGRFVGNEEVSFSGVVAYSVLYVDGDNKLGEAAFTSDFELSEPIGEDFVMADIKSEIASLAVRVGGPRKLVAKASVSSDIYIVESKALPNPPIDETLEIRRNKIRAHNSVYASSEEIECAQEAEGLRGIGAEEVEVICCHGDIWVSECECESDGVRVKAEIAASAILCLGGEEYVRAEKKMETECKIPCDMPSGECSAVAAPVLTTVNVGLSNKTIDEAGGVGTSVVFNAVSEFSVRIDSSCEHELICDAYATDGECDCEYGNVYYTEYISTLKGKECIECRSSPTPLSDGEIGEILTADANARMISTRREGGEIIIDGEVAFLATAIGPDGGYVPIKESCPFSIRLACDEYEADSNVLLSLRDLKVFKEAGELCFSVEVCVSVRLTLRHTAKTLVNVTKKAPFEKVEEGTITVYYPEPSDTLWSVAKKYHIPQSRLASENMIDVETFNPEFDDITLNGVKMIMIK